VPTRTKLQTRRTSGDQCNEVSTHKGLEKHDTPLCHEVLGTERKAFSLQIVRVANQQESGQVMAKGLPEVFPSNLPKQKRGDGLRAQKLWRIIHIIPHGATRLNRRSLTETGHIPASKIPSLMCTTNGRALSS
jgi:hypothetical protein